MVVKKENGKTLFSKNMLSKMKKKDQTEDVQKKSIVVGDVESFLELKTKTRHLTKVLADKQEVNAFQEDLLKKDADMGDEEAHKFASLLPEPPNGKRRFIDYFVKLAKLK